MAVSTRALVGAFAVLSGLVCLQHLLDVPYNRCYMTYMPSIPHYLPVRVPSNVSKKFPQYGLYMYAEGGLPPDPADEPPGGIPLVFVHGSAGNRGQIRSLASILKLKAQMMYDRDAAFTVYTVDFAGELSALYGGLLPRQADYLQECLRVISVFWQKTHPTEPFRVIFIGHSMGGVVARSLYLNPNFDVSTVALHIELASPTKRPVIYLDRGLWEFYEKVTGLWSQVGHVLPPVLSIMGGERDLQVRSDLGNSPQNLKVLSESVPECWASADHACIMWCKQLQLALSRALIDVSEVIYDRERISKILSYHFVRKFAAHGSLQTLPKLARSVDFQQGRKWQEMFEGSWRFAKKKTVSATSLHIPIFRNSHVTLVAFGLKNDDWLFGCTQSRTDANRVVSCVTGVDISRKNRLIPPLHDGADSMFERIPLGVGRVFHVSSQELFDKKFDALVVNVPALLTDVVVLGERYDAAKRRYSFNTYAFLDGFFSKVSVLSIHLADRAVYHRLELRNFQHLWQAYTVKVHNKLCMDSTSGLTYARFHTDWSNEERFFKMPAVQGSLTVFNLKLYSAASYEEEHNSTLEFYFDPDCAYEVYLQFDLKTSLTQLLLYHGEGVLAYCFALVLVVIARQLADLGRLGICFNFGDSLARSATFVPLTVVPALLDALPFLPSVPPPLTPYLGRVRFTQVSNTESLVVRALLYTSALGLILLCSKTVELSLNAIASIYIKLKKKMRTSWEDPRSLPQCNENHTSRTLTVCLMAVLAVSFGAGGGLCLVGVLIVHLVQVIVLACQNQFLEDRKGASAFSSRWKLQSSLFLMQVLCLPLYIPSVLVWLKSMQPLPNDPFLYSAPITTIFATVVSQPNVPHPNRYYYRTTGYFVFLLAVTCVLVCQEAMFRFIYIQLLVFGAIIFQQNFKP